MQAHAPHNTSPPLGPNGLDIPLRIIAMIVGDLVSQVSEVLLRLPVPNAVARKQQIDLLKRALIGLRIQRPHHGNCDGVTSSEDVQRLFANCGEHDRAEKCEPAVANRPSYDTPGVALGSNFEWKDLSRVQPGYRQPCRTEYSGEDENHGHSRIPVGGSFTCIAVVCRLLPKVRESTSERHRNTLTSRAPVTSPATTDAVEREHTDERGKHVENVVETRYPLTLRRAHASNAEDGGRVDGDTGDADPFLHDLEPDNQLHASTSVQLPGTNTEEHVEVALLPEVGALQFAGCYDVLEFGLSLLFVRACVATESAKYVATLGFTTDLDEPT